jgi:hypothetical protein
LLLRMGAGVQGGERAARGESGVDRRDEVG